ncbi:hypothetical protein KI387_010596, partial [Taxus chinensis]
CKVVGFKENSCGCKAMNDSLGVKNNVRKPISRLVDESNVDSVVDQDDFVVDSESTGGFAYGSIHVDQGVTSDLAFPD